MSKIFIAGAGGFIAGHLVSSLKKKHELICADIKTLNQWYQKFDECENYVFDLKEAQHCNKLTKDVDYIYNFACNMGGMGFIENNKAECMLSVLINTNLLNAALKNKVKKYFFASSACVYSATKQINYSSPHLKEEDAYPAEPEDGYGWEKLFSERMCRHFYEDFGMEVRVARYHNVYGPHGTWIGGREKAPAALIRKFLEIKYNKKKYLEIWGDGKQLRSFMYIEDCIKGTNLLFNSTFKDPLNIGVSDFVSINQLVDILVMISGIDPKRKYILDAPKGVNSRSSDNTLIKSILNWEPSILLKDGMKKTYEWIENEFKNNL